MTTRARGTAEDSRIAQSIASMRALMPAIQTPPTSSRASSRHEACTPSHQNSAVGVTGKRDTMPSRERARTGQRDTISSRESLFGSRESSLWASEFSFDLKETEECFPFRDNLSNWDCQSALSEQESDDGSPGIAWAVLPVVVGANPHCR